jgi:hypothetical protein
MGSGGSTSKKDLGGSRKSMVVPKSTAADAKPSDSPTVARAGSRMSVKPETITSEVKAPTSPDPPKKEPKPSKSSSTLKKQDSDKVFSKKKLDDLFAAYKDAEEDHISNDGLLRLCSDLGLDPTDVLLLVLSFNLGATSMNYTKEQFVGHLQKLNVDTIAKLKAQLPSMRLQLDDVNQFRDIYRFAFTFTKEPDQKILDMSMGISLLDLIMADKPHAKRFVQFLQQQSSYKALNMDQWINFLEFSRTIKEDFSNYDENSAWPVMIDEYAVWAQKK